MIPVEAATRGGVIVANVPGVNASSVAEHVVFSAIALLRAHRTIGIVVINRGRAESVDRLPLGER